MRKSSSSDAQETVAYVGEHGEFTLEVCCGSISHGLVLPGGGGNQSAPLDTREAPSVGRSILVTGRDLAVKQLRQLPNGDLHGAEHGITLHGDAGDSPAETFCEVGVQRIRHDS
ncbi:hypothetical protein HJ581_0044175 [Rhodococcus opacus]|nr:hypothetical protein HJ581_0044175 [Rhodococcus opacus]